MAKRQASTALRKTITGPDPKTGSPDPRAAEPSDPADLTALVKSWELSLRATNKSPKTVSVYLEAARQLLNFLASHGMPTTAHGVRREHVESYLVELMEKR